MVECAAHWRKVIGIMRVFSLIVLVLASWSAHAQSYSVDWYKISGGGGASSNGTYQVNGTIGQPDAGGAPSGGNFSVTGGFWSIISVVQTAGVPNLLIIPNGPGSVQILWPATGNYLLQQNTDLTTTNWVTSGFAITNGFGTNFCTIAPPVGNLFFRLTNP